MKIIFCHLSGLKLTFIYQLSGYQAMSSTFGKYYFMYKRGEFQINQVYCI